MICKYLIPAPPVDFIKPGASTSVGFSLKDVSTGDTHTIKGQDTTHF